MWKAKILTNFNSDFINLPSYHTQIIIAMKYILGIVIHPSIGLLSIIIKLVILEDLSFCHICTINVMLDLTGLSVSFYLLQFDIVVYAFCKETIKLCFSFYLNSSRFVWFCDVTDILFIIWFGP